MSIKNFGGIVHIGTYNDHHKEATFHVPPGTNTADLIRTFMSDNAEDVTTEDLSSNSRESNSGKSLFCCITQAAYDKGVAQQVEDELRSACKSAPKLIKAIKTNEALGYLDTKNLSSKDLYDLLNEHFGLPFERRNFRFYRSK